MKTIFKILSLMLALAAGAVPLSAQIAVPPAGAAVPLRAPEQLDQLLGPIALYPDPLIAEILPAATLPSQIVIADRYLQQGMDPNAIDQQPLDPSVKALAHYPAVLSWMDQNIAWTTDLGQAFLYQQADVMNSIQRLRAQALALGNLQSTPQQTVISQNGLIQIVPANPQVIYVPVYQPQVVYVERAPSLITFGIGVAIGAWLNHDLDWHHHDVVVWGPNHPRPREWWYGPQRPNVIVNENINVWRPHARGPIAVPDRGDRGWERHEPAGVISRPSSGLEIHRTAPVQAAPPPPSPRGALIGVPSARQTHEYSQRGQQSRGSMGRGGGGEEHGRGGAPAAPARGGTERRGR